MATSNNNNSSFGNQLEKSSSDSHNDNVAHHDNNGISFSSNDDLDNPLSGLGVFANVQQCSSIAQNWSNTSSGQQLATANNDNNITTFNNQINGAAASSHNGTGGSVSSMTNDESMNAGSVNAKEHFPIADSTHHKEFKAQAVLDFCCMPIDQSFTRQQLCDVSKDDINHKKLVLLVLQIILY